MKTAKISLEIGVLLQRQKKIANDYSLTIEGKPLPVSIVELTPMRLVLLDTFGYHLVLEQKGSVITLYDEAEDCHYSLTKIA